jgi:hypothetical protein
VANPAEDFQMRRISLICVIAATMAANGAFAQNAAAPGGTSSTTKPSGAPQSPSATPSQNQSRQTHVGQSADAAQPGGRRQAQTGQSARPSQDATETRPDAKYPHPSGQDSQPDHSSGKTKVAAVGSKKDKESGQDQNPKATGRSSQVDHLAKQKAYTGNSGSKGDPGTACSTARQTADGGLDCGTGGNSATMGKIVTKSH